MKTSKIAILVFGYRLLNAFSIGTFFQPDEFYQALEPAHFLVYGYGYITWEWAKGLRSFLHPLLYTAAYGGLRAVFPNHEELTVEIAPKLVGAAVATFGELYTYKFALHYTGSFRVAGLTLVLSLLSPWNWFFITRAFSNNLEMSLTAVALALWPWHRGVLSNNHVTLLKSSVFGFLSCAIRPSNAVLWVYLGVCYLVQNIGSFAELVDVISSLLLVFIAVSAAVALPDSMLYGNLMYPPYQFLKFNVFQNLLVFYGRAPWHFYVDQGLPLLLMAYFPLWIASLWRCRRSVLVHLCVVVIVAFSAIPHKEFRFLVPLYPVFMVLTAQQVNHMWRRWSHWNVVVVAVVAVHVAVAFFFSRVHERGEIDVMNYLKNDASVDSIGMLTPCHSTPWHLFLHRKELVDKSWMVTCEPPLHLGKGDDTLLREYRDELDRFYDDPEGFLARVLDKHRPQESGRPWPSHLVVYEHMEPTVSHYLTDTPYSECARFFNGFFHWDPRRRGDIIVFCNTTDVTETLAQERS